MSDFEPILRPADHPLVGLEMLDGPVARLTLQDSQRRNALRIELSLDIEAAVHSASSSGARALILTSSSPIFCSGGDLDDLVAPRASLSDIARGANALAASEIPTIAVIDGSVIGAGINLALACDVILCTPEAVFDPRLLDLGVHPGGGQLRDLSLRIGRQGAVALSLLGDTLDGIDAASVGLAWRCVPSEQLMDLALRYAARAASRPHEAMVRAKRTLDATLSKDRDEAIAIELEQQKWSIEQPWIAERVAELRARLDRRPKG